MSKYHIVGNLMSRLKYFHEVYNEALLFLLRNPCNAGYFMCYTPLHEGSSYKHAFVFTSKIKNVHLVSWLINIPDVHGIICSEKQLKDI